MTAFKKQIILKELNFMKFWVVLQMVNSEVFLLAKVTWVFLKKFQRSWHVVCPSSHVCASFMPALCFFHSEIRVANLQLKLTSFRNDSCFDFFCALPAEPPAAVSHWNF